MLSSYGGAQAPACNDQRPVLENLRLARRAVRRFGLRPDQAEEAEQEAVAELLVRLPKYDGSRGVSLPAFVWPYLTGAVRHYLRREKAWERLTEPLEQSHDAPDPSDAYSEILDMDLDRFLESLSDADRDLLRRIYWDGAYAAEVARDRGIARQSIHVRHKRLLQQARTILGRVHEPTSTI